MATGKTYLIQFLAQVQGSQIAVKNLKQIEGQIDKTGKQTKRATNLQSQYVKALKRVLVVVPIWMAFRTIIRGVTQSMRFLITTAIELDDELSRIKTVMRGTGEEINAQMAVVKQQILDTATNSRLSIKELAEGFYFLQTSNLDATEAMAGFEHTVNLAVGTQNSMAESARAVAGIYNTMGKYLGDNLSVHEKFAKIADTLAYTYATQDVQLSELIQSYTKLAPYVTGLSDNFIELTTMLGFLNTRLLRGGRTGRLTGRAILQLTKNAQQLANQFGITFKGDEPIALLETIGKIHDAMQQTGKTTAEQGQQIQQVFATRGGVAIRLLLEHWDELNEQVKEAIVNVDGFAKKMNEIRMNTIAGQVARTKNIFASLFETFITGLYGTQDLASAISQIADHFKELEDFASTAGRSIGFLSRNIAELFVALNTAKQILPTLTSFQLGNVPGALGNIGSIVSIIKSLKSTDLKSWERFNEELDKMQKVRTDNLKEITRLQKQQTTYYKMAEKAYIKGNIEKAKALETRAKEIDDIIYELLPAEQKLARTEQKRNKAKRRAEEASIGFVDKYNTETAHTLALMKELGASELTLAEAELERIKNAEFIPSEQEHSLAVLKAQQKVTQEALKQREKLTEMLVDHEVDLLKIYGLEGSNLLLARQAIEDAVNHKLTEAEAVQRVLDLEKQVTQERKNQNELSNDTIKLYRLAQKYGVDVASQISDVIRGVKSIESIYDTFGSAKTRRAFEEFFPQIAEQRQAREFFFGTFGEGRNVPIIERPEEQRTLIEQAINRARSRQRAVNQITNVANTIPVSVAVNVNVDGERITRAILRKVESSIRDKHSELRKGIDNAINTF